MSNEFVCWLWVPQTTSNNLENKKANTSMSLLFSVPLRLHPPLAEVPAAEGRRPAELPGSERRRPDHWESFRGDCWRWIY